jgi:HK97 family phage major capsid protein
MPKTKTKTPAKKGSQAAGLLKTAAALAAATKKLKQPVYGKGREPGQLFGIAVGGLPKDSDPYSFCNVVKAYQEKNWEYAKGEKLVHEDLLRAGYDGPVQGILCPFDPAAIEAQCPQLKGLREKMNPGSDAVDPSNWRRVKALAAFGDDTTGGALVMPQMATSIVELLRPLVVMERAGTQVIQLPPSGQLSIARQTTDPAFAWLGENKEVSASDPAFGNINLSPKKAAGRVVMSNDSLRFTNPAIEMIVRRSLASRGALFEDQAYLEGTGSSFQPRGLINYAGIQTHTASTLGTDGNTFSFEDPSLMIGKVLAAPDPEGPTAFVMRPELSSGLMNRRADAVSANDGKGPALWWITAGDMEKGIPQRLRNVPAYTTTNVSNTRTKGSGAALTYVVLGNFRHAVIARSGVMELAMDQGGTYFDYDQTAVRAIFRVDFALLQERPFVLCDQLVNS